MKKKRKEKPVLQVLLIAALALNTTLSFVVLANRNIDQLEHIGGSRFSGFGPERVRSVPDGIARALSRWLGTAIGNEGPLALQPLEDAISRNGKLYEAASPGDFCPRCRQASLITQQGCLRCRECGYKEC